MNGSNDFATVLRKHIARAVRTTHQLAQLTGIALRSIENWTSGKVQRPRLAADVLRLAQALDLDALETNLMLRTAGHPPLDALRSQTGQLADASLQMLLATWPPPPLEPTEPQIASAIRHQLRPPVADFVGREAEVSRLTAALQVALERGSGAVISGLHGMGGIGKTELAYLLAHRLRAVLPDAQLVLNLRGSSAAPLSPVQALQTVIRTLDPEAKLKTDLETLQAQYRSTLHGQRVLLIADDAAEAAQVRPLLPPQGCVLLVTSRVRFTLPGMLAIDLEVLAEDEAVALLQAICTRLSDADADSLARACGYLPLALRVSGSILQVNPALSAASYTRQLADERVRLAQLRDPDDPHLDVAVSLTLSYARLDATAQAVFRQLGVFVAPFSTELARQAIVVPDDGDVAPELRGLLRRNLVMYDAERERWRLHDLVRDLARQQLEVHGEMDVSQLRYTRAAIALAEHIQDQYTTGDTVAALTQFDTERSHIDTARRWALAHVETPEGARSLLDVAAATRFIGLLRYEPRQERLPLWEQVRTAAQRLGDRLAEGRALNNLGIVYSDLGDFPKAIGYYQQRLIIARAIGDRLGEGSTLNNLGLTYIDLGQPFRAISYFEQDLVIARELGDRLGESCTLGSLGDAYSDLGDPVRAIDYYQQRLAIAQAIGDRNGESQCLGGLGLATYYLGKIAEAIPFYERRLAMARDLDDQRGEGVTLGNMGLAYSRLGQSQTATGYYEQALSIARAVGDRRSEGRVLLNQGNVATDLGDTQQAIAQCEAALVLLREIGARREEGYALSYLARALAVQGDLAEAAAVFNQALVLLQEVGERWGVAESQWFYGMALAQRRLREQALPLLRATLPYKREIGHAQEAEHVALIAHLEVGELGAAGQPEQGPPGRDVEKTSEANMPPAKGQPPHKGLPEDDRTGIK
jgi:tetratricopeptide (TPR) repeat protein/transcriptional regulator with XRE-family HTH domain